MTFKHKLAKRLALNDLRAGPHAPPSPSPNAGGAAGRLTGVAHHARDARARTHHPRTLLPLALLAAAACDSQRDLYSPELQNAIVALRVSPPHATLPSGAITRFAAYGLLPSEDSIPAVVTWSATGGVVGPDGEFTAGAQAGQFTIIATHAQKLWLSDTATVAVASPLPTLVSLVLQPRDPVLGLGDSLDFHALGITSTGDTTSVEVTWSAQGGALKSNGKGRARYKPDRPGRHKLKASTDSLTDSTTVTVTPAAVASVDMSPGTASLLVGQTLQVTATPRDSSGHVVSGVSVTWTSTAPTVATVSEGGLVTAIAAGTTTITATCEGKSGSTAVTVAVVPVASLSVAPSALRLAVGQTGQLSATPRDSAGNSLTGRPVTWASTTPAVATVTGSGLVTALAPGTTTITATSEGASATAAVTVADTSSQTSGAPVFEEVWDYDDSADLLANPNGWFGNDKPPGGGVPRWRREVITLDVIGPAGESGSGISKSLRLGQGSRHYADWYKWTVENGTPGSPAYDPNGSYPAGTDAAGVTVGKLINLPPAAVANEVWVEVWYRFGAGWKQSWSAEMNGRGGSEGIKMLFLFADGGTVGRPEIKVYPREWSVGYSSPQRQVLIDGNASSYNSAPVLPIGSIPYWPEGFNDVWHYFRIHMKGATGGESNGFMRFHDGKRLRFGPAALGGEKADLENLPHTYGNGVHQLAVGINQNVGPWNSNMTLPPGSLPKTAGYLPGDPYPGRDKFFIPADWQPGQWYWFGPIRVWTQDPGWGW